MGSQIVSCKKVLVCKERKEMGMRIQHRHGHKYHFDPREKVHLHPRSLTRAEKENLSAMQDSYLELLHDRLIEDITDSITLDTPIYRIDTLDHFKDALRTNELYLANPCNWDDPWESFVLRGKAGLRDGTRIDISAMKDSFFAQCWSRTPECEGIWKSRYYAPSNALHKNDDPHASNESHGRLVKIKTTVRLLMREVYKIDDTNGHVKFCIGAVRYKNSHDIDIMHEKSFQDPSVSCQTRESLNSLLTKRIGYKYENEVRLIYHENFERKFTNGKFRDFMRLPDVDFRRFACEIEVDPWCPYGEFNNIKTELEEEFKIYCIEKSSLMVESATPTILFGKDCFAITPTHIIPPQI